MLLLRLIMFLFIAASFVFTVTQVLIPLFMRTTLFPMFRQERTALLGQIQEVKAQLEEKELQVTLQNLQSQLAKQPEAVDISQGAAVAEESHTTTNTGV